jgi:hypothetical protein
MLDVFAEFETKLRGAGQLEGIATAKVEVVCRGRPAPIDAMKAGGIGIAIALTAAVSARRSVTV